jgi:7-keto-8-aminopelargonate synthetase-like enzyme
MNELNIESNELFSSLKHLKDIGLGFQYYHGEYNGRKININGNELLHFANCSYLGLERHPDFINAAIDAVKMYGTQNSVSRALVSSPLYKEVESYLPLIFPGFQVVYPSTTLAHCSALPIMIKSKDAIILDAYVHNSVRMAAQLCKANGTLVLISKHNDMEHLKYLIKRLKKEGYRNIWYCADGIYSMHGDFCNAKQLYELLDEEENFFAYVDDAHGLGCYGKHGCGYIIGNFGLHEKIVVAGSLQKSIAAAGGIIIVKNRDLAEHLKLTGQTIIYSTPIPAANLGSLVASIKFHLSEELERYQKELLNLIHYFREKCKELSLSMVTKDITPIQLLRIGAPDAIAKVQRCLIDKGFLPTIATYPVVSKSDGGIRITITRHLTPSDIDSFLNNLDQILKTENIKVPDLVNI